eukprot:2263995-Rhodomonas_salina.1
MPAQRAHITRFEQPSLISAEAVLVPALLGMYIEWLYIGDSRHVLCQWRPQGISVQRATLLLIRANCSVIDTAADQ